MSISQELYFKSSQLIPGGVNSPVRAWTAVGGGPLFIARGQGSKIYDVDGKEYIDYVLSWGPLILGHAYKQVVEGIKKQLEKGLSYGAPTEQELILAELIREAMPSMEMVRLVNSGTEAIMTALRIARAYTGRKKILKFEGCYHGHSDSLLARAGSGLATLGIPGCPGVPEEVASLTLTIPYNDLNTLKEIINVHGDDIAAAIVEPVAGNMGVVIPEKEFLPELRRLTQDKGILLIFDEVITGFRFTWGGWQNVVGISPDLTCLGKIIGGGLPIGALGGKRDIMSLLAPLGPVYQAGTLSGNPVATCAGLITLQILRERKDIYTSLADFTGTLCREIEQIFTHRGLAIRINHMGSMFTIFFTEEKVRDFASAARSDVKRYAQFFQEMIRQGIYPPPSQFEAWFTSIAHTADDLEKTIAACRRAVDLI
ncbi:MAG: glutamate-1-semialdehyde 2,1-aminomutase [Syntrophales bacterium]|nr:glutamate-1-semialdehyde 2,1-aminomutase [Syntrophales bacterium]